MAGKTLRQMKNLSLGRSDADALADRINATDKTFPQAGETLHGLFLAQAARNPGRTAVAYDGGEIDYAGLAARATVLAARLRARGLEPGEPVAIAMEKSWRQVVAVLAVLQAGGVFVPVDPSVPADRLRHILGHATARLALTRPGLEHAGHGLAWPEDVEVLTVDEAAPEPGDLPAAEAAAPTVTRQPDDLAYVIYTSGSTGQPKGVMISHRGAVNTVLDINDRFGIGPQDRVLALSSLSFDLAVYDIFGALGAGAAVVMPEHTPVPDPDHWARVVRDRHVTVWNSVPALMELVTATAAPGDLASLRLVMLSGDWIRVGLPADLAETCPKARVISLGGATEASIWSIVHPIEQVDTSRPSIPYGRPMANQRFHVLDAAMERCPLGVAGSLWIAGTGVALGYWRDAERTAHSFVVHPRTGERLYRTGDRGRLLPDGDIEFLGREDFQVKVQGFRVELGEIEAVLRRFPGVEDAVAVADKDATGAARLVAFLRTDGEPDLGALRTFAAGRLPAYMLPADLVRLESWPLTANGKVDRTALPIPRPASRTEDSPEPEGALQLLLTELWAEILETDAVGVRDDFFQLGGHSLRATRLVTAFNSLFGTEVPVRAVFEAGTVEAFCAWLEQAPDIDRADLEREAEAVLGAEPEDGADADPGSGVDAAVDGVDA
ncbi:amino acid adenylation domain-containing protein [Streptomyces lavendulae]|uniref:amino acid adenylation domain-containing protein n=1 Tax=Streptomyces lavendulae TaxID=1914 RepID=UPI003684C96E